MFRKIGDFRLPLCVFPRVALQLFAFWNSITDLQIAKTKWPLAPDGPAPEEYIDIAPRNVRRARIRLTIVEYRGQMGSESEPRDAAGYLSKEPSDDELLPLGPEEVLLAQQSFPVLGPTAIRFRIPLRPNVAPRHPPPLNRIQKLLEWAPRRFRRAIWNFPIVML